MSLFDPGTLWQRITVTAAEALEKGALVPIATQSQFVEERGVRFLVRVVSSLARKEQAQSAPRRGEQPNPFLAYDPQLYVADAGETHVCLLNKYNVVDHHLLIVTRQFEHQETPLTREDFLALWRCLTEYQGLGFYNAGKVAGASQPHKHLQVVPLPLAPHGPPVPIEPLLDIPEDGDVCSSPSLPFAHVLARLPAEQIPSPGQMAATSFELYHRMLQRADLSFESDRPPTYNLLVTRQWMLLVPRRREHFESISLNALAFAGALLVRNASQLEVIKACGPMRALQETAG